MVSKKRARRMWRVFNPVSRPLSGVMPWWVLLETTGRRTGQPRRTPLAAGPHEGNVHWVIAVHGRASGFVRNIEADPHVRLKRRGRWHEATATVEEFDPAIAGRFNRYARTGPSLFGIDPVLVKLTLSPTG